MTIIPKAGKVLLQMYKEEGKNVVIPGHIKKRKREGKVLKIGKPLKKVSFKEGDDVIVFTGGIKKLEDDQAIIDQENVLAIYE